MRLFRRRDSLEDLEAVLNTGYTPPEDPDAPRPAPAPPTAPKTRPPQPPAPTPRQPPAAAPPPAPLSCVRCSALLVAPPGAQSVQCGRCGQVMVSGAVSSECLRQCTGCNAVLRQPPGAVLLFHEVVQLLTLFRRRQRCGLWPLRLCCALRAAACSWPAAAIVQRGSLPLAAAAPAGAAAALCHVLALPLDAGEAAGCGSGGYLRRMPEHCAVLRMSRKRLECCSELRCTAHLSAATALSDDQSGQLLGLRLQAGASRRPCVWPWRLLPEELR